VCQSYDDRLYGIDFDTRMSDSSRVSQTTKPKREKRHFDRMKWEYNKSITY